MFKRGICKDDIEIITLKTGCFYSTGKDIKSQILSCKGACYQRDVNAFDIPANITSNLQKCSCIATNIEKVSRFLKTRKLLEFSAILFTFSFYFAHISFKFPRITLFIDLIQIVGHRSHKNKPTSSAFMISTTFQF
ncbi:hypothetical protein ES707_20796 [subsurface metagenome]